ncbi:polysaccharide pyruvyl transferase family protein [Enterococcus casseliflavus]|uniref:polysaccharide pyruvyl transferase family protein n=1 Tax=Enterococcus casseliflavus TaxID=37734 RepID=UPI003D104908
MIGILTFQKTTNYGALLQMWALYKKIEELGYDSEIIQYKNEAVENREEMFILKDLSFKKLAKFLLIGYSNYRKHKIFDAFIEREIKMSKEKFDKTNISMINNIYEKIIVGSDQVWNYSLSGNDFNYFLQFIESDEKINSYAASFGVSSIENYPNLNEISEQLKRFNNISTRELEGRDIIKLSSGVEAEVVLDPTFLISKEDWSEFADGSNLNLQNEKYILLYLIQDRKNTLREVKKFAKKNNLKIKYINISPYRERGIENIRTASPEDFINLISNAELILTGSYHGIVLSLNLNKNLAIQTNINKLNYNSRINTIISTFKLEKHLYTGNFETIFDIDYENFNQILLNEKKKSINFLENILNENFNY